MSQVYIADLSDHVGETVEVRGWLYNRRSKGKIHFLILRDGSGFAQGIIGKGDVDDDSFDACSSLGAESSIIVQGLVKQDDRAPGGFELGISGIEILQTVEDYPIAKQSSDQSGPGPDFLLDRRHLWLRSKRQHAIMRIRHRIIQSIRNYFDDHDFINVDPPIFTPAACEGTTTLFETPYFDQTAYLTQSGQLYMEAAAQAHGRVYSFGPTFRAEKSKTRRHLTEFWMVEPEIAYATIEDVMDLAESFLQHIVTQVLTRCATDLEALERDTAPLTAITAAPFDRMTYDEVVTRLNAEGHEFTWGEDFGAPDETAIGLWSDRPIMVHRWPRAIKAFYMQPDPNDERLCLGVDVLAPEGKGEIIGGAQRANSLSYLEQQIADHNLPKEAFEWYLDLRRFGACPSAGFGLGLERTVSWITGIDHVRECIPFPRTIYRLTP